MIVIPSEQKDLIVEIVRLLDAYSGHFENWSRTKFDETFKDLIISKGCSEGKPSHATDPPQEQYKPQGIEV